MKVKIGIDIDNVIAESYPAYISKFNLQFNVNIRLEEIREFYYLNRFVDESRTPYGKEMVNYVDELIYDEEFQLNLKPIDYAQKLISDWLKKGYLIHYITSRPMGVKKMTLNWLKKQGFWVNGVKLDLFDEKKGYKSDVLYKKDVSDRYNLNFFVEDAYEIAMGMDIPVFLIDQPWNRGRLKKKYNQSEFLEGNRKKVPYGAEKCSR